jgi:DNA-binding NtrC family response regulator
MTLELPQLLITDDDVNFRETLRMGLEPRGFRTILAGDGEEALQIVRSHVIHLALLDMHMPRLTGLETLRLLHEVRAMLPCILMSAQLDEMLIEQAKQAQAFAVLAKPITMRQLTAKVRRALELAYNWHFGQEQPCGERENFITPRRDERDDHFFRRS